jgi:hypothetical protein
VKHGLARVVLVTALVAGCQQRSAEQAPEGSSDTPEVRATIVEVELGHGVNSAHQIEQPVYEFSPSDTVWASVKTESAPAGTTVEVRWVYTEGGQEQVVAEDSETAVTGTGYTYFFAANVNPWPVGTYEFRVGIDGGPEETRKFNMREPSLPGPARRQA